MKKFFSILIHVVVRRKTIYEYHKFDFLKEKNFAIKSKTALYLKAAISMLFIIKNVWTLISFLFCQQLVTVIRIVTNVWHRTPSSNVPGVNQSNVVQKVMIVRDKIGFIINVIQKRYQVLINVQQSFRLNRYRWHRKITAKLT